MIYQRKQQRLAQGKKCTATDARYFQIAENLLYTELGVAFGKPKQQVCRTIIDYINQNRSVWLLFCSDIYKWKRRESTRKILFDFLKNRQYNYNKRVAGKRKSSLQATRFYFTKRTCRLSATLPYIKKRNPLLEIPFFILYTSNIYFSYCQWCSASSISSINIRRKLISNRALDTQIARTPYALETLPPTPAPMANRKIIAK